MYQARGFSPKRRRNESGMVTAETAMVIPTLFVVACLLLGVIWLGAAQAKLNESGRFLARSISQGDSKAEAKRRLGDNADHLQVTVKESGDVVTVRVSTRVAVPTFPRLGVTLSGSSVAAKE